MAKFAGPIDGSDVGREELLELGSLKDDEEGGVEGDDIGIGRWLRPWA